MTATATTHDRPPKRLSVDGKVADSHPMPKSLPIAVAWDETFNVGLDNGTSVADQDYQVPFRFTGKLDKLTVQLKERHPTRVTRSRLLRSGPP